jgi:hypothetical protein
MPFSDVGPTGFLVLIVAAIVALIVAAKARSGHSSEEGEWPFYAKKPLSTPQQVLESNPQ